jgi:glyoxylase-like metal-dependent hydrolase (beta-lactamase superfamily II)
MGPKLNKIHRIPVWIPIRSLAYINVYMVEDDKYTWLIDAGMFSSKSILSLARGLRELGKDLCKVDRVVITHFHVDHSTMSVLLAETSNPKIFMGRKDMEIAKGKADEFVDAAISLFLEHGMPKDEAKKIRENHPAIRLMEAYEDMDKLEIVPLDEGDVIRIGEREFKVLWMPGHTPGHIVLWEPEERIMFVGDTMLLEITPHVTIHYWDTDPLGDYMNSLRRIIELNPKIAYPGHRDIIEEPVKRAKELIEHHENRLKEVVEIIRKYGPQTGYEIAKKIKWRVRYSSWDEYPYPERFFAMGEALAHLRKLEVEGLVEQRQRENLRVWTLRRS